jgi:SAM-dependent methyltransferase
MNNDQLRREIQKLRPWYQNVRFNGEVSAVSSHSKLSGECAWSYIKQLLPESLEGKRVLDLGSNAGLFCIRTAQMGAEESIGIEREPKHLRQCDFLKQYFDTPNVKFINSDLENLSAINLGKFDIVLAIAVLYWVGRGSGTAKGHHYDKVYRDKEIKFIQHVTTLSDEFIVRARGSQYNNSEYYSKLFDRCGFNLIKLINEDVGSHEMMLFGRKSDG